MNDTFATSQVATQIKKIQEDKLTKNGKTFKIIYYYPIDCSLQPEWASFIRLADIPVAYTEYGKIKTYLWPPLKSTTHLVGSSP